MKTIEENNRMIAEFMGHVRSGFNGELVFNTETREEFEVEQLKYHTSWDWLMPVVEEVDHLEYESERLEKIDNAIKTRQIVAVHGAVVEFIEWYNENK